MIKEQVDKEVFEKCKDIIKKELTLAQNKLRGNKGTIRALNAQQRIYKAEIGKLFETLRIMEGKTPKVSKKHSK